LNDRSIQENKKVEAGIYRRRNEINYRENVNKEQKKDMGYKERRWR
jgi:hypothetical protein